jgi:hypothetical protein
LRAVGVDAYVRIAHQALPRHSHVTDPIKSILTNSPVGRRGAVRSLTSNSSMMSRKLTPRQRALAISASRYRSCALAHEMVHPSLIAGC